MQINIRGLINKRQDLETLLTDCIDGHVHVAIINEMWLKSSNLKRVNLHEYSYIGHEWKNRKGGGTDFLCHNSIHFRPRDHLMINTESFEHSIIELKTVTHPTLIISVYRPPNSDLNAFLCNYDQLISKLSNTNECKKLD